MGNYSFRGKFQKARQPQSGNFITSYCKQQRMKDVTNLFLVVQTLKVVITEVFACSDWIRINFLQYRVIYLE